MLLRKSFLTAKLPVIKTEKLVSLTSLTRVASMCLPDALLTNILKYDYFKSQIFWAPIAQKPKIHPGTYNHCHLVQIKLR